MNNPLFCYFETADGQIIARAKVCGDNILPQSCYYDPFDAIEPVRNKLNEDVFPILNFLEQEICREFKITVSDIVYSAFMNFIPVVNGIALQEIPEMTNKYLDQYNIEWFELFINIEFSKNGIKSGIQLKIIVDKITWQDLEIIEGYPVWVFHFQGVTQPVDLLYSKEQTTEIVTKIMNDLHSVFNEELLLSDPSDMKVELIEIVRGAGLHESVMWRLINGSEVIDINNIFKGSVLECNWIGTDKKFVEVMCADRDSLELFAILNLKGEIIMNGIRGIKKYIEAEQIFIVEITGRAFEEKGIDSFLASDAWNTAVINNYGDIIIPPDYSSICFEEATQTFIGNGSGGAKVRFDLYGSRIKI